MITKRFHKANRQKLLDIMEEDSLAFFMSGREKQDRGDQMYGFIPDANYYYMTGHGRADGVLLLEKSGGEIREVLYVPTTDERMARWLGVSYTAEEIMSETGISQVHYLEDFQEDMKKLLSRVKIRHVYLDRSRWKGVHDRPEKEMGQYLEDVIPAADYHDLSRTLALMRQVKTSDEIALHRRACEITTAGVERILHKLRSGMYEYEIEAEFDYVLGRNHAGHAFSTIAASGPNACVMHYVSNDRKMQEGDMILFDLGAEWGHYAADVSRTYPVSGKFTPQQRRLYEVVLKGLEGAIACTRPGQKKKELQNISKDIMAQELIKLGMIEKPEEIARYYHHGSGHFIGLYTHDVGDEEAILEKDMMFTLEPGLYFDELSLGIRIEDTILITEDGCEVLSGEIPKRVEDIEACMAQYKESN